MRQIETTQVLMKLTDDPEVLTALRRNNKKNPAGRFKEDEKGEEVYTTMFDSRSIQFRKGVSVPIPKTIADNLMRDNHIIVGEHIDGDVRAIFEFVRNYELGEKGTEKPKFACPECGKDMRNRENLSRHLGGAAHAPKKGESEKLDYDTPLEEVDVDAVPGA